MNIFKKKNLLLSSMILIFVSNFIFAACGTCEVQDKPIIIKKTNSTSIKNMKRALC